MPGDLFGFVLVKAPTGRRMLLNLDLTLALMEQEGGLANAISLAGFQTETGEPFESYLTELLRPAT